MASPIEVTNTHSESDTGVDLRIAAVLGVLVVALLLRSVPLDLLPGDAGEFQFAAWRWGLAHPTGYPLYLLLGGAWQHLWALVGVSPAASLNILSAVLAGVAVALFYWLAVGWLPGPRAVRRMAAVLGAAFFAANPTLRSQALQAEVYTLHALFIVIILLTTQRAIQVPSDGEREVRVGWLVALAGLFGLSLTHHATTLLLIPPVLAYLFLLERRWWRNARIWLWGIPAFLAPFLLYLYIPWRSGPDASPWYHQRLGNGVLTLYDNTWPAFLNFITGRSISVSFHGPAEVLANLPTTLLLWQRHVGWVGLVLIAVGIFILVQGRRWPLLVLTVSYVVLQVTFNLFYAIGDIFVYYLPVYLVACLWIAFGAAGLGTGLHPPERAETALEKTPENAPEKVAGDTAEGTEGTGAAQGPGTTPQADDVLSPRWALFLLGMLLLFPVQLWVDYAGLFDQLKADSARARATWNTVLAARPPADAILVSNDRNEIVPLFYLQAVEGAGTGHTGLFPLIAPDARFADIGATVQTALDAGGEQPVYLFKETPGLEARFALAPRTPPLVEVLGPAATSAPRVAVDQAYGPLHLLGYDLAPGADGVQIDLHWRVDAPPAADLTTTVQLFDEQGVKLGQDDRRPGGDYYPTTLWKPGETLIDRHTVTVESGMRPARLLVGMYAGPDAGLVAPALELQVALPE
jgi:hypothetical protein